MLSAELIQRHFEAGDHEKLLRDVASNGLELPLPLRLRLSQGPVAAIALGLRRLTELTYGPTPLSRDMIAALLDRQRDDGAFVAGADGPDPLATATAIAAFNQTIADHPATATGPVLAARERAIAALATMQDADGLFHCPEDRDQAQRALVTAFIFSLLAGDERFRTTVRLAELMSWFDERMRRLDEPTRMLYRLGRVAEPGRGRRVAPTRRRTHRPAAAAA